LEIQSKAIDEAVSAVTEFRTHPNQSDFDGWEPEYQAYIYNRQVILCLATAQALLSPIIWRYFNGLQRDIYIEVQKSLDEEYKTAYYIKNPKALEDLIEITSSDAPTLHCTVTQDDLSAETN
jgi:hypothetical protein